MHRAAQAEDLRLAEVSLPIARKDIQRIPAFRCRHQVGIALAGEVSGRQKIRPDGNAEHFGLRQKRRRKLPAPDSLEGRIALRRERIQISPVHNNRAASRRRISHCQILDSILVKIPVDHRERLTLPRGQTLRSAFILRRAVRSHVSHLQSLAVLQPDLRPALITLRRFAFARGRGHVALPRAGAQRNRHNHHERRQEDCCCSNTRRYGQGIHAGLLSKVWLLRKLATPTNSRAVRESVRCPREFTCLSWALITREATHHRVGSRGGAYFLLSPPVCQRRISALRREFIPIVGTLSSCQCRTIRRGSAPSNTRPRTKRPAASPRRQAPGPPHAFALAAPARLRRRRN